ncbi:MAG: MCE family protein [Bacteroidales bacterium]|nr:MCE family protein [Bacteroidales bacterium]
MKFRTEAKIGLIVLATIALVIWGINFLKGKNVLKRTDVYYAVFNDVGGLKMSGSVILSGFKVGMVNDIEFSRGRLDRVVVAFSLNSDFSIPKNSEVQIYSNDIMGNKVIRIVPSAEKEYYNLGDTIYGVVAPDMISKITGEISPLVQSTTDAVKKIDTLLTSINSVLDPATQKKLQMALANLETTTSALSKQLSPGGKLDKTFTSLQAFTGMLDANKDKLGSAFANIESITDSIAKANITQTVENINATFAQSQLFLEKINKGEGSLGLLASNDSLYNNLAAASKNLSVLLEDMNQHPKRYVHFSVFGKKDK